MRWNNQQQTAIISSAINSTFPLLNLLLASFVKRLKGPKIEFLFANSPHVISYDNWLLSLNRFFCHKLDKITICDSRWVINKTLLQIVIARKRIKLHHQTNNATTLPAATWYILYWYLREMLINELFKFLASSSSSSETLKCQKPTFGAIVRSGRRVKFVSEGMKYNVRIVFYLQINK